VAAANDDWGSVVLLIGVIALIAIPIVIFIGALVSIVSSSRYTVFGKIIWIVVTFCFPILGPIVWFIWGRNVESIVKNCVSVRVLFRPVLLCLVPHGVHGLGPGVGRLLVSGPQQRRNVIKSLYFRRMWSRPTALLHFEAYRFYIWQSR